MKPSGINAVTEVMLMIAPTPLAASRGAMAADRRVTATMLRSIIPLRCAGSASTKLVSPAMPALLIRPVIASSVRRRDFDAGEVVGIGEVGGDDVDRDAGVAAQLVGKGGELVGAARDEDQIMPAAGEAVGIDGADAVRCAGDEEALLGHGVSP